MFMKKILLVTGILSLMAVAPTFAATTGHEGGGGDASESRVNDIRSDILKWINDGGAQELNLPSSLSYGEYEDKMTEILQPQKVMIGFVENDNSKNEELRVLVNGTPKTCRGFISKKDSRPHILCNISRFNETTDSEQYKLIHHEYAGLVGIEKNNKDASDYGISSQITDFLKEEKVLKLAVKRSTRSDLTKVVRLQRIDTTITTRVVKEAWGNETRRTKHLITRYEVSVTFINEKGEKKIITDYHTSWVKPEKSSYNYAVSMIVADLKLNQLTCENLFKLSEIRSCYEKVNSDPAQVLQDALDNGFERSKVINL
jgi:hypothetical protein